MDKPEKAEKNEYTPVIPCGTRLNFMSEDVATTLQYIRTSAGIISGSNYQVAKDLLKLAIRSLSNTLKVNSMSMLEFGNYRAKNCNPNLEFGMHDIDDNAYLNYNIGEHNYSIDDPESQFAEQLLIRVANEIANEMNHIECRTDELETGAWAASEDLTYYDCDGDEIDPRTDFDRAIVIQSQIIRLS